ncbi:MAG: hypothetical protein CSB13_08420 [Chloroflexi bacterium]|nr:MAG: hypothetical protein CSB13_08420 [Chloroflexota bacterium]
MGIGGNDAIITIFGLMVQLLLMFWVYKMKVPGALFYCYRNQLSGAWYTHVLVLSLYAKGTNRLQLQGVLNQRIGGSSALIGAVLGISMRLTPQETFC